MTTTELRAAIRAKLITINTDCQRLKAAPDSTYNTVCLGQLKLQHQRLADASAIIQELEREHTS